MVEIPCKKPGSLQQKSTMRVPVILPHELLHWLAENRHFTIPRSMIKSFWERWQQFRPHHPAANGAMHCPLGITGDDAKYTLGGAKVIVIAMNLILLDRMKNNPLTSSPSDGKTHFLFHNLHPKMTTTGLFGLGLNQLISYQLSVYLG